MNQRLTAAEFKKRYAPTNPGNQDVAKKASIRLPKIPTPNKNEATYGRILAAEFPGCSIMYEAVTLRLDGGNYTPDWIVMDGPCIVLVVEVKGAHRFASAGRSHYAFKEAIAKYPSIRFRFAQSEKSGGWRISEANIE